MDKFVIRTKRPRSPGSVNKNSGAKSGAKTDSGSNASVPNPIPNAPVEERASTEFNSEELISDPGLRIPIAEYNVNIRDQVRRAYIAKGPFQITDYNFPKKQLNKEMRSFQANWFKEFDWLEYSVAKDEAYCLWCYLFKPDREENTGKNAFTTAGFNNWKKALVVFPKRWITVSQKETQSYYFALAHWILGIHFQVSISQNLSVLHNFIQKISLY
nr:PREDICTED: uncharacterized protein LOC108198012 [Daucus carota subsp. sativus]